ncbi:MAG TPA: AMP-binding protein [Verrucomicrobiae bacterium]
MSVLSHTGRYLAGVEGVFRAGHWTRSQLQDYQAARLRALVRHASRKVPFYRRRLEAAGLDWRQVRGIEDLRRLPVVQRSELRTATPDELLADGADGAELVTHLTSGTTGHPLAVRRTWVEERLLNAFRLQVLFGYGMRWRDLRTSLRLSGSIERSWWARLGLLRQHSLSVYDGWESLKAQILASKPEVLEGYAATTAAVADLMTGDDRKGLGLKFVAAGAEAVTTERRRRITDGFGARVYECYGSVEFNLIAAECRQNGLMHICEGSVLVEVLRDGHPVQAGEEGEAVITALHSYAMPLLRISLGDRVRAGPAPCPCGAPFGTLERVEGREDPLFPLPDGRVLPAYLLRLPLVERWPWVRQYQLAQERLDLLRLKVVPVDGVTDVAERLQDWLRFSREQCGYQVQIVIEQVSEIPLGTGGKFQQLVSKVQGEAKS